MASVAADIVASARVERGKLFIRNRRGFDQQVAQLRDGLELELALTRRRATRSLPQNAYYWGVVVELLAEHTGYTPDEIHDICKALFIPKKLSVQDGNGEVVGQFVIGGSTRTLNKIEFGEYMESIRRWAAETLDVVIPDPESGL